MRSLSLIAAAERHHVAPKTIKAWHTAGRISAVSVGSRGKAWVFDEVTLDREVAALPRCPYEECNAPVTEPGDHCKAHRLALYIKTEDDDARAARIEKGAVKLRKHERLTYHCEELLEGGEVCGCKMKETRGWMIAKRRRQGDGVLRCASCAAKVRWKEKPIPPKGRWRHCPSCGGGPDWWLPWQEARFPHCARCFRSAPDVREQRRQSRRAYIATPEGSAAHERALHGAHNVQVASTAALPAEGLVPLKDAAEMVAAEINYSALTVRHALKTQRLEPNGLPRRGVRPRDVLDVKVGGAKLDADARKRLGGRLAKIQSVANGTEFGKLPIEKKRPGTDARIVELYKGGESYRAIARELEVSKSHVERVVKAHKARPGHRCPNTLGLSQYP